MSNNSRRFYGSIDFDDLLKAIKSEKISTFVTDAGKRKVNITIWLNEKPNEYGNIGSIHTQNKKEFMNEEKFYISNFAEHVQTEVKADEIEEESDDLPF